ncbi:MAG TPA: C39 family peptidase [Anaeromyxobacter sp.]
MRHATVVMQQWDLSCGAAALATLLTYHLGDPVTERAVAEAMLRRTDPLKVRVQGGFSLLDLQEYAEARGYEADGYGRVSLDDLVAMAPVIVPVTLHGYDHFVVFRGVRGSRVELADPAFGRRTASLAEFERVWKLRVAFVIARRPSR